MSIYKETLFTKLKLFFIEKGFKFIKTKNLIEKKTKNFKYQVLFLFHHRSIETAIEVVLSIEHIPTEKIYKKATGFSSFGTIGNEVGTLINNDNKSYFDIIIESDNDIDYAYEKIEFILNEIAEPYFNDYGNLEVIDNILNNEPNVISVHRNDQYNRCPLGLIVAKLNKRENYKELEKEYDKLIIDMSEMYVERYNQVKTYLKEL